jgi:uncharacterized protein YutD
VVDSVIESRLSESKDYEIGICCFSAKYTVLKRRSKHCLAGNQDNVLEFSNMSTCELGRSYNSMLC